MQRDINFLEQRPAFKNRNSTEHQGYFLRPARRLWFNDCESPVETTHRKLNFGNISVCVFMYVHICLCVCTYIWVSVRTYVCLCVCMYVCIFPRKLLKSLNTGQSQSKALLVGDWQSCILLNTRWPEVRLDVIPQKPSAFSFEPEPHWTWSSLILLDCHLCLPPKHWDNGPPLTQLLCGSWGSHSGPYATQEVFYWLSHLPSLNFVSRWVESEVQSVSCAVSCLSRVTLRRLVHREDEILLAPPTSQTQLWLPNEGSKRAAFANSPGLLTWAVSSWDLNPHSHPQVQVCMWERTRCLFFWVCLPSFINNLLTKSCWSSYLCLPRTGTMGTGHCSNEPLFLFHKGQHRKVTFNKLRSNTEVKWGV